MSTTLFSLSFKQNITFLAAAGFGKYPTYKMVKGEDVEPGQIPFIYI